MPLYSLYLPTSLGQEHLFIFLGLLLNMGLLTREEELIHLNHSSANHKADEIRTGTKHPTTCQQGLRVPPSYFSSSLFWHRLCGNTVGWPLYSSHSPCWYFFLSSLPRKVDRPLAWCLEFGFLPVPLSLCAPASPERVAQTRSMVAGNPPSGGQ